MLYRLTAISTYCFLKFFCRVNIYGRECLPDRGPFILAANHPSYIDPPVVATLTGRKVRFLAKEELFHNPILGLYFKAVGAISLKRNSSDFKALRAALAVLEKEPLLIFPQGLRGASFDVVHAGVGFLAKKSRVPVIAVRVRGTETVFSRTRPFWKMPHVQIQFSQVSNINHKASLQEIAAGIMEKIKSL